jgi:hypothetical protein
VYEIFLPIRKPITLSDMITKLLCRRKIINTGMAGKCRNQKAPGALPRLFVRALVRALAKAPML